MIAILIGLVIASVVFLIVFYKHSDELQSLVHKVDQAYSLVTSFGQTIEKFKRVEYNQDLDNLIEVVHDNLEALSLQFGEMKKLVLLGNTNMSTKEILAAQPDRIFNSKDFVNTFINRAGGIIRKKKEKKAKKAQFKSLYSRTIDEVTQLKGGLREEHH